MNGTLWERPQPGPPKRNTEPVTLSSAGSTDRSSWVLRPSALGLWRRPRPTGAPCSVRWRSYVKAGEKRKSPWDRPPLFARTSSTHPCAIGLRGRTSTLFLRRRLAEYKVSCMFGRVGERTGAILGAALLAFVISVTA